jgi:CRP/FNR family cyclic AMP-dependent transcriptional regulator
MTAIADPESPPENKLWYLRKSRLFERLSDDVVTSCEHLFIQKEFPKRTVLFHQGDEARLVYFVKRGSVKLARLTEDGNEVTIAILGAGDIFGEEVVFEEVVRKTVAICVENVLLCSSRAQDLFALMTRYPTLALNIAKYAREQLDATLAIVEDLAHLPVSERLMRLFQRLAKEYGSPSEGGTLLNVRLTHADIASLIGSTRETVTLQLSVLVKDCRIRMQGRSVVILSNDSGTASTPRRADRQD